MAESAALEALDETLEILDDVAHQLSDAERAIFVAWCCEVIEGHEHADENAAELLDISAVRVRVVVSHVRALVREVKKPANNSRPSKP